MRLSRKKKILIGVPLFAFLVAIVIAIISTAVGDKIPVTRTLPVATAPTPKSPTETRPSPVQKPRAVPSPPEKSPPSEQAGTMADALQAATAAMVNLAASSLMPMQEQRIQINKTVVPRFRKGLLPVYVYMGAELAQRLGYNTVSQALNNSGYHVRVLMWLPVSFNKHTAVFGIYQVGHMLNIDQKVIDNYAVKFVKMEWVRDQWLFAGTISPPAGLEPPPEIFVQDSTQDQQMFQVYLQERRWKTYDGTA